MPSISIITTVYNHKDYIAETIQSILDQDFMDWELLIWDDSPDNETRKVIQPFLKDKRIKARHHSPNKHIVGNTNFLIDQASPDSKYLAFLEGDDMRYPQYLSEKLKIFKKYPDVGLVYNELSIIDETGKIREERRIAPRTKKWYKNETDTIWKLISSGMVCFSYSTLMSRKFEWIRIHNRWNQTLLWSESDFYLQIADKHNIYGIEQPLTLYRKHWKNTSKDLNITIKHFEFFVQKYFSEGLIEKKEYKKIQILISMMKSFNNINNKEYKIFFKNFINCFRLSPILTLTMWFNSLYYRGIKQYIFNLKNRLWKK